MPVLLLAYGDTEAKTKLRKAIESRYGMRPVMLDTLQMNLKGRARAKVGPVVTWVPFEGKAAFHFPGMMRWETTLKPLGLPAQQQIEVFSTNAYYRKRGGKTIAYQDDQRVRQLRQRLWALAAGLLTPLSDMAVQLIDEPNMCFSALHTQNQDRVRLCLRPDYTIDSIETNSLNPDTGTEQLYRLSLSPQIIEVDDLMVPAKLQTYWDDSLTFEIEPVGITYNNDFAENLFTSDSQASLG